MKKVLLSLGVVAALAMTSCGAGEAETKAAKKMCECMDKEGMEALSCLGEIAEDEELANASESGTKSVMEDECPEGLEKLNELVGE